jgi:hypothetical protein
MDGWHDDKGWSSSHGQVGVDGDPTPLGSFARAKQENLEAD